MYRETMWEVNMEYMPCEVDLFIGRYQSPRLSQSIRSNQVSHNNVTTTNESRRKLASIANSRTIYLETCSIGDLKKTQAT